MWVDGGWLTWGRFRMNVEAGSSTGMKRVDVPIRRKRTSGEVPLKGGKGTSEALMPGKDSW